MNNLLNTKFLKIVQLSAVVMVLFSACNSDTQDLSIEKELTTAQFDGLEKLLPPGKSFKILNKASDISNKDQIYLIDRKGAETSSLVELCNDKHLEYLVRVSNKVEKDALKNTMVAYAGSNKNNSNLYVLSYEDPVQGRKSIFYEEGDDKPLSSNGIDKESVSISSFTVNEISNEISKELLKLSGKNALNSTRNKSKVFDNYQHEASYFISTTSLKYNVVVKIAKGKTNDTNKNGYGIHVEYLPQSGVVHKRARIGNKKRNPDYSIWYPSYGMKYYQELTDLITAVTFVTELTGPSRAIIKDYSPVAKISGTVRRTRQSPSYSFTIGGGLTGTAATTGPSLGANLTGGYTYNSETLSSTITSEDVKHIIEEGNGGRILGVQYLQDFVADIRYFEEHPRSPLGSYNFKNNVDDGYTLINGGLNKILGDLATSTHDHFFNVDTQTLPGMSRSNTNPNAMVNYFIPENSIPNNGEVKVKAKIYLDYLDVKVGQTPDELLNVDHDLNSLEAKLTSHLGQAPDFRLNLKKLGN
ncbi:hypothetical protein [Tenacibaculum sp. C7A-26P2]|uniref:hypothetical protein n=1 Tax=Tenacibaculum sp. C7A-26P2 TaxID=3447504 RepID=UPI003F8319EF